jgi:RNA polymerase sigma factor (sigma-70 family)
MIADMGANGEMDAALLRAWREGDAPAGLQLYDRHADAVARFFDNKVRTGADDLIQQTFVRLIQTRDRVRDGAAFRGFVLGVARNVLREHLRSLARDRQVDFEVDSMAALDPGPSTVVGRRREHRLLLEALRRLPIEQQIILELHYWEGFNATQLAEMLEETSPAAMRSRLSRARLLLRDVMEQLEESRTLLESTVDGLDGWAAQLREQLGGGTSQ